MPEVWNLREKNLNIEEENCYDKFNCDQTDEDCDDHNDQSERTNVYYKDKTSKILSNASVNTDNKILNSPENILLQRAHYLNHPEDLKKDIMKFIFLVS